ncbi:MAG: hypothetical protein QM753_07345 [Thermomicrobiales bacterium]
MSAATSHSSFAPQVRAPGLQEAVASSQVSVPLQATPSLQSRAWPKQRPAEHASPTVQKRSSSQVAPSAGLLQPILERAGSQAWQRLAGLACAAP